MMKTHAQNVGHIMNQQDIVQMDILKKMDKEKLSRMRSLQEKLNKIGKENSPLEEELTNLKDEKNQEELSRYVGKYYKYKNSYSYDNPWWLYIKVTGSTPHDLETIQCQKDCYGKISIEKDTTNTTILQKRIYEKTFNKELKKLLNEIK